MPDFTRIVQRILVAMSSLALGVALTHPTPARAQGAEPAVVNQPPPPGEYVAAPDLARSMRAIDPGARLDWDGEVFRITVKGQMFSFFLNGPASRELIVNGETKRLGNSLVYQNDEFFFPSEAVDLMAAALESSQPTPTPAADPSTTSTDAGAPAAPTPAPPTDPAAPTPVVLAFPTPPPIRTAPTATPFIISTPAAANDTPALRARGAVPAAPIRSDSLPALLADRAGLRSLPVRAAPWKDLANRARINGLTRFVLDPDDAALIGQPPAPNAQQIADATLEVARHARNRLLAQGAEVVVLREEAGRVPAPERLKRLADSRGEVLLTLSISQAESPEVSGLRAFFPADSLDSVFTRALDRSPEDPAPAAQVYRPFQQRSRSLAAALLQAVRVGDGGATIGGGSAPAPLFLARRAPMPAANLVLGYMTNPADSARLSNPLRQKELGEAIADALLEWAQSPAADAPDATRAQASIP